MKRLLFISGFSFLVYNKTDAQNFFPKIEPVNFSKVTIEDKFWKPRIDRIAAVTLPACIYQTETATPRIQNFINAAQHKIGTFKGIWYDDSDVFKALEAMAYSLKDNPDSALEAKADEWIDDVAAAQQPDGYLNTYFTLTDISKRWTVVEAHEDYNAGHLIEAAVAYYNSTGKRKLLDVAIKYANHIDSTFRLQNRHWFSGHEEIELALVKLYHTTNDQRYLKLADWYLQQRGQKTAKGWYTPEYWQDALPVKEQTQITGHAVRAMYLYTGTADVAAATNDTAYMQAMKKVWEDVVYRNMYITGGIGSSGDNEGFSIDYDLPNSNAYCETCASVGMVFWNQRMNLLTGESKYIDVLERSLYNGALDGLSLNGDLFFYDNVLATEGEERSKWFGTACCPANVARLVASLGNYIYAKSDDAVYVNLYVGSSTNIALVNGNISLHQQTNYPWDGNITINVSPEKKMQNKLMLRIPGWSQNKPVPGDTYKYVDNTISNFTLTVNGKTIPYTMQNGYAVINRQWNKGDVVQLNLPMEVKRIVASNNVKSDENRVALERGPLMYCLEFADNNGKTMNLFLPDNANLSSSFNAGLLNGVQTISTNANAIVPTADGNGVQTISQIITAIPYYAWANRGKGQMQVWIPRKAIDIKINTN